MDSDDPTLTVARLSRRLENNSSPDLTLSQFRVLGLLSGGEERASLLASRLSVAKPTLTANIDGLVERGLVAREALDGDRRAVRLSITAEGRTVLGRATEQLRQSFDEVLALCPQPQAVLDAFEQVRQALDDLWASRAHQAAATGLGDKQ